MLRMRLVALAVLAALTVQAIIPSGALAHERRAVGKHTFVVGFLAEPAFEGEPNAASVRVTDTATGEPVVGVERTLKATIAFGGGLPREFPLQTQFGQPGSYVARFIPTRSGAYLFTFSGTIEGQTINERFESGPGRFNDVESAQVLQFPEPVLGSSELQTRMTALDRRLADAEDQATVAEQQAASAGMWALGGVAVGVGGLLVGGYGVMSARRRDVAATGQTAGTR